MAGCPGHARGFARHPGTLFAAAGRLLLAAGKGCFGCGEETRCLLRFVASRTSPHLNEIRFGVIMATEVVMPQMGESIAEGTITKWLKNVGDHVDRDEPLFEISTDKVDAEIPSPAAGTLTEVRFKEGETVEVNTVVAVLDGNGAGAQPRTETASTTKKATPAPVETYAETPVETLAAPREPAKTEAPVTVERPKPVITSVRSEER